MTDDSLAITETTPEAWAGGLALVAWIGITYAIITMATPI